MYPNLFSKLQVGGIELKNRLVMAPLYLGYASKGGGVGRLLLEHYRLMAQSGVAMVVVENAAVDYDTGRGAARMIRVDRDEYLEGLEELTSAIKREGASACLQINHAGRYAAVPDPVAPSAVETFGRMPHALTRAEIEAVMQRFVEAAVRVKKSGFDAVELHGGTGYLLAQFVSPRTNRRDDEFGGSLENRMRFPLEVVKAVKSAVGNLPVGYRFLADEWLPDGLRLAESIPFAQSLSEDGVAYLSVMGGTYESFGLPEILQRSVQPGYMVDLAAAVKKGVPVPVMTAGRISTGRLAEEILTKSQADLIGLARVLWTDPEWPQKVREGREGEIVQCDNECGDTCMQMVMKGKPAFCVRWPHEKMRAFKEKFE